MAEAADLPGYDIGGWNGLMLPKATPRPIIDRLRDEILAGLVTPEMRASFALIGIEVAPGGPEAFAALLLRERALFGPAIRQLGIRAE